MLASFYLNKVDPHHDPSRTYHRPSNPPRPTWTGYHAVFRRLADRRLLLYGLSPLIGILLASSSPIQPAIAFGLDVRHS